MTILAKSPNQWKIDRAMNLNNENKTKVDSFLQIWKKFTDGEITEETARVLVVNKGISTSKSHFDKSTFTFFKDHGLVNSAKELTPIALYYLDGGIDYNEMLLLQLFKKQYRRNESFNIRPLVVLCLIMVEIIKSNSDNSWFTLDDYLDYMVKIESYDQVKEVTTELLKNRKENFKYEKKYTNEDRDIWFNYFETIDILKNDKSEKKYFFNMDKIQLVQFISDNYTKSESILINWEENYGKVQNGLPELINTIKNNKKFDSKFTVETERKVIMSYLFEGKSFRELDLMHITSNENSNSKGFLSHHILKSYNIDTSKKGIYSPFLGLENIVKLGFDQAGQANTDLYQLLFSGGLDVEDGTNNSSSTESKLEDTNEVVENIIESNEITQVFDFSECIETGDNILIHGNPGCGKSHFVEFDLTQGSLLKVRTTFHPEYSYSDFIGQLIPMLDTEKQLYFDFQPGPFTLAMQNAIDNPYATSFLIIEEINRGNASSIFGDIFQLLDRNSGQTDSNLGQSLFPVENLTLQKYLTEKTGYNFDQIQLPSNLKIIATMNNNDQNVSKLDNAFKRRWKPTRLDNLFNEQHPYKEFLIPGTQTTWSTFVTKVNEKIIGLDTFGSEDKQIGIYFIDKNSLIDPNGSSAVNPQEFSEKVLDYIWHDVARFNRELWFGAEIKTVFQLNEEFITNGLSVIKGIDF